MPSQLDAKKLDIIANPQQFGIGASETAHRYYQRNPVMLSLPDFVSQLDEAKIDKIGLINPALKGVPVRPRNERVAKLLEKYPERFIGFAGFDPNNGRFRTRN